MGKQILQDYFALYHHLLKLKKEKKFYQMVIHLCKP